MKLADLLPSSDQAKLVEDLEQTLLTRRRRGAVAGALTGAFGVIQFLFLTSGETLKVLESLYGSIVSGKWEHPQAALPTVFAVSLLLLGLAIYLLFRRTAFLMRESREPFRYTCSVSPFILISDTPGDRMKVEGIDRVQLLHHDLIEELDLRIGRFMMLDKATVEAGVAASHSHVQVEGHVVVREERNGAWVIHVMPRVSVGAPGTPAVMARSVRCVISPAGVKQIELSPLQYAQLAARVYSRVATAIYQHIDDDLNDKIKLFPTPFRRAVALYYEADDFAHSNTIDAYDRAVSLYRGALRQLRRSPGHWFATRLLHLPVLWRIAVRFVHMRTQIQLGLARCLVARLATSTLTGQLINPIFEVVEPLQRVREDMVLLHRKLSGRVSDAREVRFLNYLSYPGKYFRLLTRDESKLDVQRELLFDAYAAEALVFAHLQAAMRAAAALHEALTTSQMRSDSDLTFLWAKYSIEPVHEVRQTLLRRIVELHTDFQIAQFALAYNADLAWRRADDLSAGRAAPVIAEYQRVLHINPGNMAAIAQLGYVYWLIDNLELAAALFEEGMELKGLAPETYVGLLSYGLARIDAERGQFDTCLHRYTEAISAEPGVASDAGEGDRRFEPAYFEGIMPAMLARYRTFLQRTLEHRRHLRSSGRAQTFAVADAVAGHAFNDFGNATFIYGFRWGDKRLFRHAARVFEAARRGSPQCAIFGFNLYRARHWAGLETSIDVLDRAVDALSGWQPAATYLLQQSTTEFDQKRREYVAKIDGMKFDLSRWQEQITEKQKQLVALTAKAHAAPHRGAVTSVISGGGTSPMPSVGPIRARLQAMEDTPPENFGGIELPATLGLPQDAVTKALEGRFKLPEEIEALEKRRDEIAIACRKKESDLADHLGKWKKVTTRIIGRILSRTKLAPLADFVQERSWWALARNASNSWAIDSLSRLLDDRTIRWERLEAFDVRALRSWGEVLAASPETRYREVAIRFGQHLFDVFWPEDFEVAMWVKQAIEADETVLTSRMAPYIFDQRRWKELRGGSLDSRDSLRFRCETIIRSSLLQWIDAEPSHAQTLINHHFHFSNAEHVSRIGRALLQQPRPRGYLRALWTRYLANAESRSALGLHREAVHEIWFALRIDAGPADTYTRMGDALLDREKGMRFPPCRAKIRAHAMKCFAEALRRNPADKSIAEKLELLQQRDGVIRLVGEIGQRRLPVVTPLAVEVGADLVPEVSAGSGDDIKTHLQTLIEKMRVRILEELGVRIPGVRFRGNDTDMVKTSYLVMINEVPVQMGYLDLDKQFATAPANLMKQQGIEADAGAHPAGGDEGSWVSRPNWDKARVAGFELWTNMEYLARHVEGLIRGNLISFVGHQEVMNLVEETRHDELQYLLSRDPTSLDAFTRLLRNLVAEGATIAPIVDIGRWWMAQPHRPVRELVRGARLLRSVRRVLPGNRGRSTLLGLSPEFELGLRGHLVGSGDARLLAMSPESCQDVLAALRTALDSTSRPALVVADAELRPHLRELIKVEWPQLPVLSQQELLPALLGRIGTRIAAPAGINAGETE